MEVARRSLTSSLAFIKPFLEPFAVGLHPQVNLLVAPDIPLVWLMVGPTLFGNSFAFQHPPELVESSFDLVIDKRDNLQPGKI
jgi:hypothetical protein